MSFEEARKAYAIRLYLWAEEEARKEVKGNFSLLKKTKNSSCQKYLQYMSMLPVQEQLRLSILIVKNSHPRALRFLGENLTDSERESLKDYKQSRGDMLFQEESHTLQKRINRRNLKQVLCERLKPILETQDVWGGGGTWRYVSSIERFRVETYFDVGGKYSDLKYFHRICFSTDRILEEQISFLAWLGLSAETAWEDLTDVDIDETAELVACLVQRFMEVCPLLLRSIVTSP